MGGFATLCILFDLYDNLARKHYIVDEVNTSSEKLLFAQNHAAS